MSGYLSEDTIAAIATALGGPIAIVRVSGPRAFAALRSLSRTESPESRKLTRAKLVSSAGISMDDALTACFRAPDSYTGEDVVELHLHGGSFGVSSIMEELAALGVRQALPGEFSFRAVKNGKMTLEQAHAVADLIQASNAGAVSLALEKMSGLQGQMIGRIAEDLRRLATLGEAGIDFADQDIDEVGLPSLTRALAPLLSELTVLKQSYSRGSRIQGGVSVAFIGLPNSGKSSFFNALLGEDRSIVSAQPGTTRDVIRERLTLQGARSSVTLRLEDTAGLRATRNEVERMGIERSVSAAEKADLVLFLADSTDFPEAVAREWQELERRVPRLAEKTLGIHTKTDLLSPSARLSVPFALAEWVATSSLTGAGISEAVRSITQVCENWVRRETGEILLTRPDQLRAVDGAIDALERASSAEAIELFAADVRQALHSLGPLVGETLPDDILGRVFSSFCIGK